MFHVKHIGEDVIRNAKHKQLYKQLSGIYNTITYGAGTYINYNNYNDICILK